MYVTLQSSAYARPEAGPMSNARSALRLHLGQYPFTVRSARTSRLSVPAIHHPHIPEEMREAARSKATWIVMCFASLGAKTT
jgi:hypothetical protein